MIFDNTEFAQFRVQNVKQGFVHVYCTYRMWRLMFKYTPKGIIGFGFWCMLSGIQ